jgi:hypothetical protein
VEAAPSETKAQPLEKKKWQYACRLFGINSLKQGATWYVGVLLGNDCEISYYTITTGK